MLHGFTRYRQCDKYLEKMSNKTTQKKFYSAPEVVVTAKLTPQAKRRKMNRQIAAFNKARAANKGIFIQMASGLQHSEEGNYQIQCRI